MKLSELRSLLAEAIRQGKKFVKVAPGGYGAYEMSYGPSYELEVDGYTISLFDAWCGSNWEGYCYRQFIAVGGGQWRVSELDGVSKKLLNKIPIATDKDIEKEFADVLEAK
jgi:hypothetical protein